MGVLPDTVKTHALVGALVGTVEILLLAVFFFFCGSALRSLVLHLTICDGNGAQQQVSTCATPLSGRPHAWAFHPLHLFEHMLSSWLACVRALTQH